MRQGRMNAKALNRFLSELDLKPDRLPALAALRLRGLAALRLPGRPAVALVVIQHRRIPSSPRNRETV